MSATTPSKPSLLTIPSSQPNTRNRPSPLQRYPSTAFFQGPNSRNASYNDLSSPLADAPDPQCLPRPQAAPSLSGPSVRPSVVQSPSTDQRLSSQKPFAGFTQPANKQDDFHPEALWAEMQRTLADVELSAFNTSSSSHIFGASHSKALEDLRKAQVALAQAWAKSEADDIDGHDSDDSLTSQPDSATVRKVDGLTASPSAKTKEQQQSTKGNNTTQAKSRRQRASSVTSSGSVVVPQDLEAETERDIKLARKRREANDRYFHQVNQGVLEVVAQLDHVADAMKQVERKSREVWDDDASVTSNLAATTTNNNNSKQQPGRQSAGDGDGDAFSMTDDPAETSTLDRMLSTTTEATMTTTTASTITRTPTRERAKSDSGTETASQSTSSPISQRIR